MLIFLDLFDRPQTELGDVHVVKLFLSFAFSFGLLKYLNGVVCGQNGVKILGFILSQVKCEFFVHLGRLLFYKIERLIYLI